MMRCIQSLEDKGILRAEELVHESRWRFEDLMFGLHSGNKHKRALHARLPAPSPQQILLAPVGLCLPAQRGNMVKR
jgi:hypothetical protein